MLLDLIIAFTKESLNTIGAVVVFEVVIIEFLAIIFFAIKFLVILLKGVE